MPDPVQTLSQRRLPHGTRSFGKSMPYGWFVQAASGRQSQPWFAAYLCGTGKATGQKANYWTGARPVLREYSGIYLAPWVNHASPKERCGGRSSLRGVRKATLRTEFLDLAPRSTPFGLFWRAWSPTECAGVEAKAPNSVAHNKVKPANPAPFVLRSLLCGSCRSFKVQGRIL